MPTPTLPTLHPELSPNHLPEVKRLVDGAGGFAVAFRGVQSASLIVLFEGETKRLTFDVMTGHPIIFLAFYPTTDGGEPGIEN